MRRVGKSFTGSLTLTVSGLIFAQTALSLLIGARWSVSKRARLISGRLAKTALQQGRETQGYEKRPRFAASILRDCGKNTRRSANCIKRCARLSS